MLTHTARDVLEGAFVPLWVRGEVGDFKAHRNGHWYFSLRDGEAQVRCVVWARDQRRIPAPPDEGMQVVALGQVTVYTARGDLQLCVKSIEARGDGLWRKALEATLARLGADGLLAPERKRPLPPMPRRIAVVTSADGAALHDVIAVVRRRCPIVEIVLVSTRVQGDGAPDELCSAIDRAVRWGGADLLILARGGGARDDLWAFNDERVARALAMCPIPTISAVGHEIDVTLCDLVADVRAPTPSAAAEAAVPVLAEAADHIRMLAATLAAAVERRLGAARRDLELDAAALAVTAGRATERRRASLMQTAGRLHALSPLATLARGYALPRDARGSTMASVNAFAPGMPFNLLVRDGRVEATVVGIETADPAKSETLA
jgi:exodeoxyribonuclease VII large subunit